jgi:type III pantothenate kinase
MAAPASSLIVVDVGNSRVKVGQFEPSGACPAGLPRSGLPIAPPPLVEPVEVLTFSPRDAEGQLVSFEPLAEWISTRASEKTTAVVASVNRPIAARVIEELKRIASPPSIRALCGSDLPIENLTRFPDRVGIDRLAAAVAANRLRRDGGAAIVVDFGTAITVDLITATGAFAGGAILPGIGTQASSLRQGTDALPEIVLDMEGKSPSAVGTSTDEAIAAGLYWGAVGAVRELIARQSDRLISAPQVFVTGGTSPEMARLVGSPDYTVRYVPHLVLSGLAIAVGDSQGSSP